MNRRFSGVKLLLIIIALFLMFFIFGDSGDNNEEIVPDQSITDEVIEEALIYNFRTEELYELHYQKHGDEFGNISKETYLEMANDLIRLQSALIKYEEDGDRLYYGEEANEFLVLSSDGYIRTFFRPDDGIDYYNRQ